MDNFFKIRRKEIIVCLFLVASSLFVYLQVINYDFIYFDDELYVIDNPNVKAGLSSESIIWAFSADYAGNWHPLTWLSHMVDIELYGLSPMGHHLTNLQIHIVNSVLLFILLNWMTGAIWQSAFVAAVFALHPLHVESVAWVAERKNVLSTFFWMLTMLAYVHYSRHPNLYRYLLTLLLLMFGLMAKPMLITLPFVLLLLDYWPLRRLRQQSPFHLILEKVPFLLLSFVSIYLSFLSVQQNKIILSAELVPMKLRVANALVSYVQYIEKMVWPTSLAVFYPFPDNMPIWQVLGACLLLVSISVLVLLEFSRKPYLGIGWLWYLGTLVPVIGLTQVGLWPAMADRWAYIPLIGIFIIISWGVPGFLGKWRYKEISLATIAAIILIILSTTTWFQARHWQNGITIFKHTVDVTQNNCVANCELGHALMRNGKLDDAVIQFYNALRINPNHEEAHANLGYTLACQGKVKDAIYHYNKTLRINRDNVKTHNNLGVLLAGKGKFNEAFYHYQEALRINPKYAGAYYNLGKIYANKGKIEDAILYYKKTLQVSPNMPAALYNLSWIGATSEDDKFRSSIKAVELAEKLCKLQNYTQPLSLDTLAAAYAEAGRFKEAVLTAKKGLALALEMGPKELALGLENRLKLYHAGRPYRQNSHK